MVAQSTQEAEYISLSWAGSEALWLRKLKAEMTQNILESISIICDNQAATNLCNNEIVNEKTKHIGAEAHFVRDTMNKGIISAKYLPTSIMMADLFTKNFRKIRHWILCK